MESENLQLEDGLYTVDVQLEGGSGRASITSPAELTVQSGKKIARIEWSSSHYDYMVVQDEKLLPVNTEGNSVFEVPVSVFDEAIPITADTTAMSIPHEIEYTLTFASASVRPAQASDKNTGILFGGIFLVCAVVSAVVVIGKNKRKKKA